MKFRVGLNYWPIRSAMSWWRRFDAGQVAEDFERVRQAGFDSVRIFLLWEDFQPEAARVSRRALDRLARVANLASAARLSLIPTLFTGHMSGVNWIPLWALDRQEKARRFRVVAGGQVVTAAPGNWYEDETLTAAQAILAREVALALRGHAAVWAWDLGNENSNCAVPPSRDSAVVWLEKMAAAIRSADPSCLITIGLHMEDLEEDRRLGPLEAARVCDFLSMHGYPIYASWAEGPTDAMALPFLGLVTRRLGGRDVLFQEFGIPAVRAGADRLLFDGRTAAAFTREALASLHRFGFLGAMVWCYGDYSEDLWNEPPLDEATHERFFGLWRTDGSPKPALAEINYVAGARRREPPDDLRWFDLDPEDYYSNPSGNLRRLYRRFREHYVDSSTQAATELCHEPRQLST